MDFWNQSAATEEFSLTKDNMPIVQQLAEKIPGGFFVYQESGHRESYCAGNLWVQDLGGVFRADGRDLRGHGASGGF